MTARIATQTQNQSSAKNISWFVKSSLAAVALMATLGSSEAFAAGKNDKCRTSHGVAKHCNTPKANRGGNHDDLGKGLVVLGGLLVGAAILNEVFDGNDHNQNYQQVHHQPTPQPVYGNGYGYNNDRIGKKRRKRLVNKCSSAAINDALANGYSNAWLSRVKKVERKGDRRFKITGTLTQQFQQRAPRQHSRIRGQRHWNNGYASWGYNNQPRYVTYEEKRNFSCIVKRGEVRKLRKW